MNPITKRDRSMLEEEELQLQRLPQDEEESLITSTSTYTTTTRYGSSSSPKRLRGGGGNPYAKGNRKPSVFAKDDTLGAPPSNKNSSNNRPSRDDHDDDEDNNAVKPYYDAANVGDDDDDFFDEIQEEDEAAAAASMMPAVSSAVFSDITETIRKRWLRPPSQVTDNSQDLSLQWLDMDLLGGKPLEENPNETLDEKTNRRRKILGSHKGQVPIIRAYGITEAGNSVTVFIHGYSPYAFFALPDGAEFDDTPENRKKIVLELEQRLEGAARGGKLEKYCHRVEYVSDKKSIMGYETSHTKFLRVTVAMPTLIPPLKRIMEEGIQLPGVSTVGGNDQYAAFECNVPFVLRYMIDEEIAGAGWMTLPKKTYQIRDAAKMQTHSQVGCSFQRRESTLFWYDDVLQKLMFSTSFFL